MLLASRTLRELDWSRAAWTLCRDKLPQQRQTGAGVPTSNTGHSFISKPEARARARFHCDCRLRSVDPVAVTLSVRLSTPSRAFHITDADPVSGLRRRLRALSHAIARKERMRATGSREGR